MSSSAHGSPLSDEDHALMDHLDQQVKDADGDDEYEAIIAGLRSELRQHKAKFRQFERDVQHRLEALEADSGADGDGTDDRESMTDLEMLAQMTPEVWEDQLSTSKVIALTMHANWDEIAWKMGDSDNRRVGVDTRTKANAKYNPSKLKYRLKKELDWEPAWEEIYRALKKLADLAGGEEFVDDRTGRVQVMGGDYLYNERATPDGKQTKRVLWKAEE